MHESLSSSAVVVRDTHPLLLTVREVRDLTGLGRDSIYNLAREGRIPHLRVNRRIRIPRDALLRWIDEQAAASIRAPSEMIGVSAAGSGSAA